MHVQVSVRARAWARARVAGSGTRSERHLWRQLKVGLFSKIKCWHERFKIKSGLVSYKSQSYDKYKNLFSQACKCQTTLKHWFSQASKIQSYHACFDLQIQML